MQQEQYYRTVKASERLPDKEGTYYVRYTTGECEVLYASGINHEKRWKALVSEWLEPIEMPDADRLREAAIAFMSTIPIDNNNIYLVGFDEALKKLREALSAGDGWVRVEAANIDNGLYDVWVEEAKRSVRHYFNGQRWWSMEKIDLPEIYDVKLYRPLPSPPIK